MTPNSSISELLLIAENSILEYAKAETELNELMDSCDYSSESRFETYDKMDEQRRLMDAARRKAFKAVKRVANIFGNDVDYGIAGNISEIANVRCRYHEMHVRLYLYGMQLGYQFDTNTITKRLAN